ncbi:MAG: hypothetical protein COB46_13625 [Rhodospirillaceae bacterium]|nr:hypothetical protein [Colwellia sp.]PCI37338.1 MAG: hypothetical protein COB46_13625 [Rhodospirillaceae bacterium]
MNVSDRLKQAVADSDVIHVRAIFKRQLDEDREKGGFATKVLIDYTDENGLDIFHLDDGNSLFTDSCDMWTENLWDHLFVELNDNFSREKIKNLWLVMSHLRQVGHSNFQIDEKVTPASFNNQDKEKLSSHHPTNHWWIGGGIVALVFVFLTYKALTD